MSYEKCKRITLDKKNNKIKICIASNNVRPITYYTTELCASEDKDYENYTFEDKLITLYENIKTGCIQISTINDNTEDFEYAMCKVREYFRQNNIDSYEDLYEKRFKVNRDMRFDFLGLKLSTKEDKYEREKEDFETYEQWRKEQDKEYVRKFEREFYLKSIWAVYGESFKIWKQALEENIEGKYKIKFNNYYYISKLGKYDRGYSSFSYGGKALEISYKRAYILINDMQRENRKFEIEEIKESE